MKKIVILVLVAFAIHLDGYSQCNEKRFPYVSVYGQVKGAGIEVGGWPKDSRIGMAAGIDFITERETVQKPEYNPTTVRTMKVGIYGKGIFKLNRYFYLTGTAGLYETDNPYLSGGIRISIPIKRGYKSAFLIEPQYGTRGANILAGLSVVI